MLNQKVCAAHGGHAPAAMANARRRELEAMVAPAMRRLRDLIDDHQSGVALAAVRDILDRNGYKPVEHVEQDGRTVISIEYVGRPVGARADTRRPDPPPLGRPLIEFLGLEQDEHNGHHHAADPPPGAPPSPG